jgi:thioredoxin 1
VDLGAQELNKMSDNENVVSIYEDDFEDEVIDKSTKNPDKLYVLKLWMEACGPCRMLTPIYERLALTANQSVKFFDVCLDESPKIAKKYSIQTVPTILFIKNGEQVDSLIGLKNERQINDKIISLI